MNYLKKITSVVVFIVVVAFNNQLLGIIVAATTLVGTYKRSVNVNSTDWRAQIADGIYETIVKHKTNILSNIEGQVKNMCWPALQELNEVSDTIIDLKRCLGQTGQKPCHEWQQREVFNNKFQKYPSLLPYLDDTRKYVHVL